MSTFRMSAAERAAFLAARRVAVLAVEREDASPLAVPVWYGVNSEANIVVWTELGTVKERLIRASGRFTLVVQDEEPPYAYLSVEGSATIRDDVTPDDIRPIVARYVAADEVDTHIAGAFNDQAVLVTMRPTRWFSADYNKT